MPVLAKTWTEEELLALPKDDGKYELVNGELELTPPVYPKHGALTLSVAMIISDFFTKNNFGKGYGGKTGFWMKSGNLRSPDISFIPHERIKELKRMSKGFFHGAPDLIVEVLSMSKRPKDIPEKLQDYFESGTRLAWLLDSFTKTIRVYRDPGKFKLLRTGDTLDGEDVLPGFKISVAKIFND